MNALIHGLVAFLVLATGSASAASADEHGCVDIAGRTYRDVIATCFDHPFQTDADMSIYFTNTRGRVVTDGGAVMFSYPGIKQVLLKGSPLPILRAGPNLAQVKMPAGTHDVEIIASPGAASLELPMAFDQNPNPVSNLDEFKDRAKALKPGDELVIKNGVYSGWGMATVTGNGRKDKPILIRPETPGGVIFTRRTQIQIEGTYITFKGFRFEHAFPAHVLLLANGEYNRVTQCQFFHCGNPTSTFSHIVRVTSNCHRSRVDHCYFTGSKSMSLGLRVHDRDDVGVHNRFDHNIWRDIYRFWGNGQENIQLGGPQRGPHGDIEPHCTVEYGLFDHAWGDSEIISNKCSSNTICYNVAAHCLFSAFTLRGGNDVRFEGNVMVNNAGGLRVFGKRHVIVNNLFMNMIGQGVRLEAGSKDKVQRVAAQDTVIANNTFLNCPTAISADGTNETNPYPARNNKIWNNLFLGHRDVLLTISDAVGSDVNRNLFGAIGRAKMGDEGKNAIIGDPELTGSGVAIQPAQESPVVDKAAPLVQVELDRWKRRRPHGPAPDIGADEVGAGQRPLDMLPDIPTPPLLAPHLYKKEFALSIDSPPDTGKVQLPQDFVMEWDYLPQTWEAEASLTFCADGAGGGYTVSWGGVDNNGAPTGVIALRKSGSDEIIADGADIIHHRMSFYSGKTFIKPKRERPERSYIFTLIKNKRRIWLALRPTTGFKDVPAIPVLVWEDRGTLPTGRGLQIQQKRPAFWKNMNVWACGYTGPAAPPLPEGFAGEAKGGRRIALRWRHGEPGRVDHTYEIYRDTKADFIASKTNCLASRVRGSRYDDFDVEENATYHYRIRARNIFDLTSGFVGAEVASGTDGPLYLCLKANSVSDVKAPLVVHADPDTGEVFLWAPPYAGSAIDGPPKDGVAEYIFNIAKDGTYAIWGLAKAPNHSSDSFYIALDAESLDAYRGWSVGVQDWWMWRRIRHGPLTAGRHTLRLKHREGGAKIRALLITDDLTYDPSQP